MKKASTIGLVLCIAMSIITTASAAEKQNNNFLCLGSGISHSYKNIPFEIGGVFASVSFPETYYELRLSDTINLSGYTTTAIHIIEHAAYADNVPDGVVVGHVKVNYQDGDDTSLDLVMGQNIAEWAYDRPEIQHCLQHTKILPAYSFETATDSGYHYLGHYFYISIDTQEKPLSHLELTLDPSSYTNQKYYGCSSVDWFAIAIKAVTISLSQSQSAVSIIKSANPSTIHESEATTLTLKIENIGSADAKNVEVADSIPAEFTLVTGSMNQIYDTLKPNEYRTYQYTIKATKIGRFVTDVASATYEDEKGNSYSSASNPVTITVEHKVTPTPTPTPTVSPTPTMTPKPTITPTPTVTPTPVVPDFYRKSKYINDGKIDEGGAGLGFSSGYIDGNNLNIVSRALVWGEHWAEGKIWDEFTYYADDHPTRIKVSYQIGGDLVAVGVSGKTDIEVHLRVWDITAGEEVASKLLYSKTGNTPYFHETINEYKDGYINDVYLRKNHNYRVELIGKVSSSAQFATVAMSNFGSPKSDPWSSWFAITWIYDEVSWWP